MKTAIFPGTRPEIIKMSPVIQECKRGAGIYHITNEGVCSWYKFASAVIPNIVPCSSDEFIRKAKCPKYSVLVNTKTEPMLHWKDALKDYLITKIEGL